jgi:hypothetical protein
MRGLKRAIVCLAAALATACASGSEPVASTAASGDGEGPARLAIDSPAGPRTSEERPEPPKWREVTIPAGTTLPVALETAVGSDTSRVEDPVRARVTRPIVIDGVTVVPEGSSVSGVVTDATRAGKVKGTSHVAVRFNSLSPAESEERYDIATSAVARSGREQKKKDAVEIAAPAAGGAVIGGIVGGKKGAVIGGAVGGGAGTAVVLNQRGEDVRLGRGAALTVRLTEPLTVRVKG